MRIGIVGHFAKESFSSELAMIMNGHLGQTIYTYPVHIHPEEFKYRHWRGEPDKLFPLSEIINGDDIEYLIVPQACLSIHNDMDIPVLYYHREIKRGLSIDRFDILALKYPTMMKIQELRDFDNKFLLQPCAYRGGWILDKEKDIFISDVDRNAPILVYKRLMERSKHVLIHGGGFKGDYMLSPKSGVSVRALEGLRCDVIPILFVKHLEQYYRNMGFNESNSYFNELPIHYDLKKVEAGKRLLKKHTILERAKQILEVIKNGKP